MKRRASQNISRLLVIMVMAVVMVTALATVGFAQTQSNSADKECYLAGDMNADGVFDNQDAYHALFSFLLPDKYSVDRDWDINKDQEKDQDDAIALLYAYMLPDLYSEYAFVYDMVHDYFDPAWNWEETAGSVTATVTVQCACGEPHTLTAQDGVVVTKGQVEAPTCTQNGSESYTAVVTYEGESFTGNYTKVLPAVGHTDGRADYNSNEHFEWCGNCGEKMNAESHNWKTNGEPSAATCKVQAVQNYKCDCGAEKQENVGYAEHNYQYLEGQDVLVDADSCEYAKQYKCSVCDDIKKTDKYNKHNHIAVITKEANCQNTGTKIYQCTECSAIEKTDTIPVDPDKHIWDNGTEQAGAIVYSCTVNGCDEEKKTVTATENGTVTKDALDQADELKLNNDTSVSLGQTVKDDLNVQNAVQIEVGEADRTVVEALLRDKKDQIEGITVYDFNMTVDGTPVTKFKEKITITMPYTLQPGEDADAIYVWFIDNEGNLEEIKATYSKDGFVTFQTDHFSYYTVTRLTPEERCAKFGHILTEVVQAATCTADGYIKDVCQRCSYEKERENVDLPATGHSYKETSRTDATCEAFGVVVETCENCKHERYTVERALGHSMQLSNTKKATCEEAGYEEYTCGNNGCGYSYQVALAQLTHNYLMDKTVAASCTAGGYDLYVCEHCGGKENRNETIALGHDYSTDSAQWNDDQQNPAVTLSCCREGCSASKVLKANIFTKEASCEVGGIVEAVVSYNNKTFKKTLAVEPELGHKLSGDWIVTDNTHYLQCENCGAKSEVATHNYDDGVVTEAPTCVSEGIKVYTCRVCKHTKEEKLEATGKHAYDDGVVTKEPTCAAQGTKTYTCGVCGKTIAEKIEATGEHKYEDGKCVTCGKEQVLCDHESYTSTRVDLSGYNICEGFELYLLTCDCGEVQRFSVEDYSCDFKEENVEEEYFEKSTVTCTKCGLVAEMAMGYEFSADPCVVRYAESGKIFMGDQVIAQYSYISDYFDEHPVYKKGETIEVTLDGFCGMTLTSRTCPCGAAHDYYVEDNCKWQFFDGYQVCQICGVVCRYDTEQVKDENCLTTRKYITNYYNQDGKLIYSYDEIYISTSHEQKVDQYELYGDTCADGIKIWYVCEDCGEEEIVYLENQHPTVLRTETDLTDAKICGDTHVQSVCPCGSHASEYFVEGGCNFIWYGYNEITDTEMQKCSECGVIKTYTVTRGQKNEKCQYLRTQNYTYTDIDGNVILTSYDAYLNTQHDLESTYELKGSSCSDGVLVNEFCRDCDYSYQYESKEHERVIEKEFYTEDYGICPGYVYVVSCACGERCDAEFGVQCEWMMTESGEEVCVYCGTTFDIESTEKPLTQCLTQQVDRYTFSCDGEVLLSFQNSAIMENHRWVYEFELMGTSCEEGYRCTQTCTVCGEVSEWGGVGNHTTYTVDRQLMTNTGLCGDVEILTVQCPCGKNTGTSINWIGQRCQFEMVESQEENVRKYVCTVCKAERHNIRTTAPVEGNSCMLEVQNEDSYVVNGTEIIRVGRTQYNENHEWVTEYKLLGESCADGVEIREYCTNCDAESTYVMNDHYVEDRIIDLAEYGFCGGQLYVCTCPCGENNQCYVYYMDCKWENVGEPSNKEDHNYKCAICEGTWTSVTTRGEAVDQCSYEVNTVYTFTPANGEPFEFISRGIQEEHDWNETYELLGQLCTDGVIVTRTCANCGRHESDQFSHHRTWKTEEYDLSEYGMCSGTLMVSTCYCGKDGIIGWDTDCKWNHVTGGYDFYIQQCEECKVMHRHSYQRVEKIGTCYVVEEARHTFYTVENEVENILLTVTRNSLSEYHRHLHTFELADGDTCTDSYWVNQYCADCDYTSWWRSSSKHELYAVKRESVSQNQLCGNVDRVTYSCACGEKTETRIEWVSESCNFESVGYDEELGGQKFVCRTCKAERYSITSRERVEGTTCQYLVTERLVYRKDGVELFDETITSTQTMHNTIGVAELLGEDCDGGYYYRSVCADCNTVVWEDENIRYGCSTMLVKRELLVPESIGLCGKLYWDTYSCACGKEYYEHRSWVDGYCDMVNVFDPQTGEFLYSQCRNCGICEVSTRKETPGDSPRCEYTITETVSFMKDGEVLYSYEYQRIEHHHRYVFVYRLLGNSCEDGYTCDMKCIWCGHVEEGTEVYRDHDTRLVEMVEIIRDGDNVCGEVMQYVYSCACGQNYYSHVNHSCWFENIDGQPNSYRCRNCGMTYEHMDTVSQIPGSCEVIRIMNRVYTTKDGVSSTFYKEEKDYSHETVFAFKGDCENGYLRTGTCVYCGVVTEQDTQLRYGHERHCTDRYDLADYGMCGGYLERYSCACGADVSWNSNNNCQYNDTNKKNEDDAWVYHCNVCGTDHSNMNGYDRHAEDCYSDRTFYFNAVRDGKEVLRITEDYRTIEHTWVVMDYEGTCGGNITAYVKCRFCDETETHGYYGGHPSFTKEYIYLENAGCCGGYVELISCICGEYNHVNNSVDCGEMDYSSEIKYTEDGLQYGYSENTCKKCGLTIRQEWYDVSTEMNCHYERRSTITYSRNGVELISFERTSNPIYHTYGEETHTLVEGATSCTEGVIRKRECVLCGEKEEYTYTHHESNVVERYDLTEFGSVCGGSFVRYSCACGAYDHAQFDGDCKCDMHGTSIDCWVEDAIEGGQSTVDGYISLGNSANKYVCAQTDSQCGLTVRMTYCWLLEGCVATRYQIWQLGYDEDTDTCLKEIRIATGDQVTYHDYEKTEEFDDGDGDETTSMSKVTHICKNCQSTWITEDCFVNGIHVSTELLVVNKLENFEERRYELTEYTVINGCWLETKVVKELKKADGTDESRVDTYEYDITDGCKTTHTWSVNGGQAQTEVIEHSRKEQYGTVWEQPTCTQPGLVEEWYRCHVCNQDMDHYNRVWEPHGHDWVRKADGSGYYCARCLLENSNGSDGTIILEDMTAQYGNDENYVIGYYNRGKDIFTARVSIVLADGTEIQLESVNVTMLTMEADGINALSVSRDAVHAEAQTAMETMEDYDVRVTLVPDDSSIVWDYAITMDGWTA